MSSSTKLLVGTKKGAFIVQSEQNRENWIVNDPHYFGQIIYHMVSDPRDSNIILMAARTGHLGPTVFRSTDGGESWQEAKTPPAFPKTENGNGKVVKFVFWLTPGHSNEPGVWFAGTSPQGLFKTTDNGENWHSVETFNDSPEVQKWMDDVGTPAGPLTHSIIVDPRDKNHMYLALSTGGWFETKDGCVTWSPRNQGLEACFLPDKYPEYGQCVHNSQISASNPDIGFQQNHCGVYRINFATDEKWERIGKNIPEDIGDFGFPIILHPRDENTVLTLPMDGSSVWPRTSVAGKPALYKSTDAGKTWTRKDAGFPRNNAFFTILRQAAATDNHDSFGIYLGTKSGEIWASFDEGESWQSIVQHLPEIYSLEVVK